MGGAGGCGAGGESSEHEKWKLKIADKVEDNYNTNAIYVEKDVANRRVDVALETDIAVCDYAIEYQHKNKSKDYKAVTKDLIDEGFGVFWVFNVDDSHGELLKAKGELSKLLSQKPWLGKKSDGEIELGRPIWKDDLQQKSTNEDSTCNEEDEVEFCRDITEKELIEYVEEQRELRVPTAPWEVKTEEDLIKWVAAQR